MLNPETPQTPRSEAVASHATQVAKEVVATGQWPAHLVWHDTAWEDLQPRLLRDPRVQWVTLDTETTGFDPVHNELLEIGVSTYDLDGGLRSWSTLTRGRFETVSEEALAVNHIDLADAMQGPPPEVAWMAIKAWMTVMSQGRPIALIIHNSRFDVKFMAEHIGCPVVDSVDAARSLLRTPGQKHKQSSLMDYYGIPQDQTLHRVDADTAALLPIWDALTRELPPTTTWADAMYLFASQGRNEWLRRRHALEKVDTVLQLHRLLPMSFPQPRPRPEDAGISISDKSIVYLGADFVTTGWESRQEDLLDVAIAREPEWWQRKPELCGWRTVIETTIPVSPDRLALYRITPDDLASSQDRKITAMAMDGFVQEMVNGRPRALLVRDAPRWQTFWAPLLGEWASQLPLIDISQWCNRILHQGLSLSGYCKAFGIPLRDPIPVKASTFAMLELWRQYVLPQMQGMTLNDVIYAPKERRG